MSMHQVCALCPQSPEEFLRSSGNGSSDSCAAVWMLEVKPGSSRRHSVLLTTDMTLNSSHENKLNLKSLTLI